MDINQLLEGLSRIIWGNGMILLLLCTGILFTIRLRFIQLRFIPALIKKTHEEKCCRSDNALSQLKTVCMSLGTAMGTGNITGVASALAIGGAGAVFWMWVSAFFGMALVYSENYLAVTYSGKTGISGPMAYLEKGLGFKPLAAVFAFSCVLACFGMGGMVQTGSFSDCLYSVGEFKPCIVAVCIFIIIFLIVSGGKNRIGSAAQLLLPFATAVIFIVSFIILFRYRENILPSLRRIFTEAFAVRPIVGGASGFAVSQAVSAGIRRGVFSNEAGLGSSPLLHCAGDKSSPSLQGLWSIFEVFFDTFICCTLTALVLLSVPDNSSFSVMKAFSSVLGSLTEPFLCIVLGLFALCTVIGWYYCGETAFAYLFGSRFKRLMPVVFAAVCASGALVQLDTVWILSDIFNGLMAFPNLIGLILLSGRVKKE